VTGDHIRQRLTEGMWMRVRDALWSRGIAALDSDVAHLTEHLAASLEQDVRDLLADELDAAADDMGDMVDRILTRNRAAALRARTEETT
jgi:hypothetical protein